MSPDTWQVYNSNLGRGHEATKQKLIYSTVQIFLILNCEKGSLMCLGGTAVHKYRWFSRYYLLAKWDTIDTRKECVKNLEAMKCTGWTAWFRSHVVKIHTDEIKCKQL